MEYMAQGQHHPTVGSDADKANLQSIRNDMKTLDALLLQSGLSKVKG
jgi:hypothetical protein